MTVRELLSDESKWTKGAYARTAVGRVIGLHCIAAACWCLEGAIKRCYPEWVPIVLQLEARFGGYVIDWNDAPERTFAEVRALIEELAI